MNKIDELLSRRVERIYPSKEALKKALGSGIKLRLYLGIDPTSSKLHLGHTVALKKLLDFQNLGHEVIFLVGGFTAQIGDPSGQDEKRKPLTSTQIKKNLTTYKKQASKILDFQTVKLKNNADWWAKTTMREFLKLASHVTHQQLIERDMFQGRIKKGQEIWFNELIYPLLQGYDSVVMNVDLEVGGEDQTFNMLMGRKLQKIYNKKEKFVLTTPLVVGLDGRKMSKTYKNTVDLEDPPNEMFGKLMSLKDELIIEYFEMFTDLPLSRETGSRSAGQSIKEYEDGLKSGKVNPMALKKKLAWEIVKMYHGQQAADKAQREFERVFQKKQAPADAEELRIKKNKKLSLTDLLLTTKLVGSKSEAKRLIAQGAVEINGKVKAKSEKVKIEEGMIIKVGKKRFIRIRLNS